MPLLLSSSDVSPFFVVDDTHDVFLMSFFFALVVVCRRYLEQFDGVCALLHERGVSESILRREIYR